MLLALAPSSALAQSDVDRAAAALRGDPVYVDPDAELAGQVDAAALRARIGATGAAPMFIAVLPESATSGSAGQTLVELRQAVGESGTYALAVGREFRTLSDAFDAARPGQAARANHPDDLQAALEAFVGRAGQERTDSGTGAGSVIASVVAVAVLIGVVAAGAFLLVGRRRRRRALDEREDALEDDVREDFVRLGDAIRALELDVTLADADAAARADYDRAVEAYDRANAADRKDDAAAANRALEEGLEAIASARERLAGRR